MSLNNNLNNDLFLTNNLNKKIKLNGRLFQYRKQSDICFFNLNDGSNSEGIQVVCFKENNQDLFEELDHLNKGCYVNIEGTLIESPAKGQKYEVQLERILNYSICDIDNYPLKKNNKVENLRKISHLRGNTRLFGSIFRIRNTIEYETHNFFQAKGFLNLNPNIITTNECEGGAGVFTVTELLTQENNLLKVPTLKKRLGENILDFKKDHFKKQTYLTVSSQLQLEALACSIGNCYTTNKSFRSEHSMTNKHASEFTHLEIELVNTNNEELMNIGYDYINYILRAVFQKNYNDLKMLNSYISKGLIERLEKIIKSELTKISYTKTVQLLKENNFDILFGDDLNSEMESFLTTFYNGPVAVYNWPKSIKSFYMRDDRIKSDSGLCECFDLLMPYGIGELIGGSMREENYDKLINNMKEKNIENPSNLDWYLDLRRFGTVIHGGFGLGLDRLVMLCTGMTNIRDVIPFPVTFQNCNY